MSASMKFRGLPLVKYASNQPSLSRSASLTVHVQSVLSNPAMNANSMNRCVPVFTSNVFRMYCRGSAVSRNFWFWPISPIITFCLKCVVADMSATSKSGKPSLFRSPESAPIENHEVLGMLWWLISRNVPSPLLW